MHITNTDPIKTIREIIKTQYIKRLNANAFSLFLVLFQSICNAVGGYIIYPEI